MIALTVTIFYGVATLFAGYGVLHLLGYRSSADHTNDVWVLSGTAFLLGLGVTSSTWLLIGLAAWLAPAIIMILLLGFLALGIAFARGLLVLWVAAGRNVTAWLSGPDRLLAALVSLAITLLVLLGIGAFLKAPIGDAEAFYLTYPKIIAASQRVVEMPGLYANFSQIGLLGEMHFAALFALGGMHAAKLFVWPVAIATILMLLALAKYAGLGRTGQCFAFVIAITSTAFTNHITDGKIDLFAAAVGVGAFYWALRTGEASQGGLPLRVAGILAGFAIVGKFSYILALLPPLLLIVAWNAYAASRSVVREDAGAMLLSVIPVMLLTAWIAIATVPHLIKNAVLWGAPFAPFVGTEGIGWLNQTWFSVMDTGWIIMTYPLALVFGRYPMQGGNISFLLLAFLPLVFVLSNRSHRLTRPLIQITVAGVLGTALWIIFRPSIIAPRYLLATLLLFVPLVAMASERVYEMERGPRVLSAGVLVTALMALAIFSIPHLKLPVHLFYFLRGTFPMCGLASPYCEPLTELSRRAEPGDRIYFAGYYAYWLRPDLLQCRDNKEDKRALATVGDAESRWATLYARGFRYLVIDKTSHAEAWKTLGPAMAPRWLEVPEIIKTEELSVFRLSARERGRRVEVGCAQISYPAWDVRRVTSRAGRFAERFA